MTHPRYLILMVCFAIFGFSGVVSAGPVTTDGSSSSSTDSAKSSSSSSGGIWDSTTAAASKAKDAAVDAGSKALNSFTNIFGSSNAAENADEAVPQGLDESRAIIQQKVKIIYQSSYSRLIKNASAVNQAFQEYDSNWQGCLDKQATAATWCLETNNSDMQQALSSINMMISAGGLSSVTDSCSTMGKAMNIANAALTAYSAQCGVWRSACAWNCVAARKGATQMEQLVGKSVCTPDFPNDPEYAACTQALEANRSDLLARVKKELNLKLKTSIAKKEERCTTKYLALLGSAALGIANLSKAMGASNKCEDDSSGTSVAATLEEKCADAGNAGLPECICLANPRTAGCATGLDSISEMNAGNGGQIVSPTVAATNGDLSSMDLGNDSGLSFGENSANGGGESSGPTLGGGGGSSGLGGSSGFGGGGGGKDGSKGGGRSLDTNILAGAGGGGGGGYGGYRGYGSEEGSGKGGYRSYLPGGSKDPARGLAGQSAASKEVTGQGGKSNWEKVRDRYQDNQRTLFGN